MKSTAKSSPTNLCAQCGKPHVRAGKPTCAGHHASDPSAPCMKYPTTGAKVCRKHGARAPQVAAAAKRRTQQAQAQKAVRTYGLPREIDPQSALLEELHRTAGVVAWLSDVVAQLDQDEVKQRDLTGKFERPSVWIDLYHQERRHFASVAKDAIAAGIEERRVALAEKQGELISGLIRDVLADVFGLLVAAGVAQEVLRRVQREQVAQVVRTRLMALAEKNP